MLVQLFIGSIVIAATIIVEGACLVVANKGVHRFYRKVKNPQSGLVTTSVLIGMTICVVLAHSAAVWTWALVFISLDAIDGLEPAVYFSLVAFTTLGFGDIVLTDEWRVLSGLTATNGLVLFGLSTAFLVEFFGRVRHIKSHPGDADVRNEFEADQP